MSEELTTVEKEIVEYVETKLGEEDTKYIELYEFGKKLGRDRLVIVLEQLGYTVKWYSDYLFEIERKNKKEAEKMSIINLKEGERKELGKLGLLDLGGEENWGFGVIAGEDNDSLHKFSGNDMLSYNGIKLLRAMESYASLKNYPFNMHISCAGIQYPEGYYVEDDNFKEEDGPDVKGVKIIDTLNSVFKDYAFIVSTISEYSVELATIAKWCAKNDKLYFVSVYDEDDIELVKEEKLYNTIILPKGKFENEAEFLALDCYVALKYPDKNIEIDDEITTLDGISLKEKIFSIMFKDKLEDELKKEFGEPSENYLPKITEFVVSKVVNGILGKPFEYPQKFNFEYNNVEKYVIVSYEYNENIHQIKIVY